MGAPRGERRSGRTCEHPTSAAEAQPKPSIDELELPARESAPKRRKPRVAWWKSLDAVEMAAHLLKTPTIPDRVWTEEPRLPRETRTAFIRRVLLSETAPGGGGGSGR